MRQHGFPDARGLHGLTPAAPTRSRCRLMTHLGHSTIPNYGLGGSSPWRRYGVTAIIVPVCIP
jgi:hypothetical protein